MRVLEPITLAWLCGVLMCASEVSSADGPPISGGDFELSRYTVDSGGGRLSRGTFELQATAGQHDAYAPLDGGDFDLQGGFWTGTREDRLFRDRFEGGLQIPKSSSQRASASTPENQ